MWSMGDIRIISKHTEAFTTGLGTSIKKIKLCAFRTSASRLSENIHQSFHNAINEQVDPGPFGNKRSPSDIPILMIKQQRLRSFEACHKVVCTPVKLTHACSPGVEEEARIQSRKTQSEYIVSIHQKSTDFKSQDAFHLPSTIGHAPQSSCTSSL